MKKIIAMFLVVVMCFSLTSCGKVKVEEAILGDWTYDYVYNTDRVTYGNSNDPDKHIGKGDPVRNTMSFFEGGTYKLVATNTNTGYEHTMFSGTWEIKDDVVVISASLGLESGSYSLAINTESEPYTFTFMGNDTVYTKVM